MMLKCPVCGDHIPTEASVEFPTAAGSQRYCSLHCALSIESPKEQATGPLPLPHALPAPPREILVAVDGSGPSVRAVQLAASIAKATGGRLTLIHAIDPSITRLLPLDGAFAGATRIGVDVGALELRLRDDAALQLERCGRICEAAGVEYTARVEMKLPTRAIAEAADKADLIVMGSRGLGAFSGAVLGSLSHRVIGETRKPVLVVH